MSSDELSQSLRDPASGHELMYAYALAAEANFSIFQSPPGFGFENFDWQQEMESETNFER